MAKNDLERTAKVLDQKLSKLGGHADASVNKGLVTQSSSAIPIVPLTFPALQSDE